MAMSDEIEIMEEITVPNMEEHPDHISISFWHVSSGENVEEGDDLVDIITDERALTILAPCSGLLNEIFCEEGDEVFIDDVIATIEPEK
jgi:pyruvate/2-oxoglutarate dehydrogenase complex dihydrolipoamide acyltransferase (E2) component